MFKPAIPTARRCLRPALLVVLAICGNLLAPCPRSVCADESSASNASGPPLWSLQPITRPALPLADAAGNCANPIDAFVLARLRSHGLDVAPEAERRTLLRRLHYDLTGLPPTLEEIVAFERDESPDAYERRVDRLLASPHYGERWARYWLDLVRFAETCGYERDQLKPGAWKYRDWVIQSLNDDEPYDQFVEKQLAGDELDDASQETVIATGLLRLGTWNDEPNDDMEYQFERLEDLVHVTSSAFLAITIKCARCHDHKFDPVTQQDYYRVANAFWAGPIAARDRKYLGGPTPDELGYDVLGWTDLTPSPPPLHLFQKGDHRRPGPVVPPGFPSMITALDTPLEPAPANARTSRRRLQLARWMTDPQNPLTPRVLVNRLWQHHMGAALVRTPNNFGSKGEEPTHPRLLDYLASELVRGEWRVKPLHRLIVTSRTYRQASVHPQGPQYAEQDSGNRFWWRASRRRLDAEAMRDTMLVASGELDRRLGGPSFHPAVSGEALEGLSKKGEGGSWETSPAADRHRRAVYMFTRRSLLLPLMTAFDFCDTTLPCGRRDVTTVPPQALALLNNQFVHQRSEALARRVANRAGPAPADQVRLAWQLALCRLPASEEQQAAEEHMAKQCDHFRQGLAAEVEPAGGAVERDAEFLALASLCHVLLNTNEWIYVD